MQLCLAARNACTRQTVSHNRISLNIRISTTGPIDVRHQQRIIYHEEEEILLVVLASQERGR